MKTYEGIISIAVQLKAKNITEALKILDENPLETENQMINITSENHELRESAK